MIKLIQLPFFLILLAYKYCTYVPLRITLIIHVSRNKAFEMNKLPHKLTDLRDCFQ